MIRGWLLFCGLVLSVLFRLWRDNLSSEMGFPFSQMRIPAQWYFYFLLEHLDKIAVAICLSIHDTTPEYLIRVYQFIILADLLYFLLFYRDEGVGFNLFKVTIYGGVLIWTQLKR